MSREQELAKYKKLLIKKIKQDLGLTNFKVTSERNAFASKSKFILEQDYKNAYKIERVLKECVNLIKANNLQNEIEIIYTRKNLVVRNSYKYKIEILIETDYNKDWVKSGGENIPFYSFYY